MHLRPSEKSAAMTCRQRGQKHKLLGKKREKRENHVDLERAATDMDLRNTNPSPNGGESEVIPVVLYGDGTRDQSHARKHAGIPRSGSSSLTRERQIQQRSSLTGGGGVIAGYYMRRRWE